ncbi:MAG: AMP-binding protein [Bacteroidales bacterium]|nr:AMP-binding protein [Bacteroidales bacterium]
MDKLTLCSLLQDSFNNKGNRVALTFVGEKGLSYSELQSKIQLTAGFLEMLGIQKGDRVAVLGENMPNWGVAYLSVVCLGAVVVPILPDFNESEVSTILVHSGTKLIFCSQKQYTRLSAFFTKLPIPVIAIDDFSLFGDKEKLTNQFEPSACMNCEQTGINEDDLAAIIYTSGTTGSSKGVMLSHRNLAWMVKASREIPSIVEADRFLSILPMSHTYENSLGFLLPLYTGASVHYLRKPATSTVLLEAFKIVRPTLILTVPLIIEKIYRKQVLPKMNAKFITRSLFKFSPTRKLLNKLAGKKLMKTFGGEIRFFGIGGAKLDPSIEKHLREAVFPYAIGYGLTETSPLLAGAAPFESKWQSTGPAVKGLELRIDNPNPETGEGEIQAKGPSVMRGYYNNPVQTAEVFTEDGWFKTGDLGYIDKEGFLFIRGRIKNVLLGTNGENIYPEEIEAILNGIEYIEESLVVQEEGRLGALINVNLKDFEDKLVKLNERVMHVAHDTIDELLVEAQKFVNQRVNRFSKIHFIKFQSVPFEKTPTNKIKRYLYSGKNQASKNKRN